MHITQRWKALQVNWWFITKISHICVIYCIFRAKLANTKKFAKIIKCINVQNIHPWSSTSTVVGKLRRHYTHHPEVGSPSTAWSTSAVAGKPSQPFIVEKMVQNHKVHKSSKYTPLIEHINNSWEVRKSLSTSAVAGKPSQSFQRKFQQQPWAPQQVVGKPIHCSFYFLK